MELSSGKNLRTRFDVCCSCSLEQKCYWDSFTDRRLVWSVCRLVWFDFIWFYAKIGNGMLELGGLNRQQSANGCSSASQRSAPRPYALGTCPAVVLFSISGLFSLLVYRCPQKQQAMRVWDRTHVPDDITSDNEDFLIPLRKIQAHHAVIFSKTNKNSYCLGLWLRENVSPSVSPDM